MKYLLILFAIQLSYSFGSELQCKGPHEYLYKYTPVCPLQCDNLHQMKCMALLEKPSCQCKDGTVRDTKNNKCVYLTECPNYYNPSESLQCNGDNEEFAEVVSACPQTCSHPVGPLCGALIRKPSCVCKEGTIRDTVNNRCVRREECPQKEMQPIQYDNEKIVCNGLNEVFSEWISACPSKCPTAVPPPPEICLAIIHKPSCICTNGTIRDTLNNKCVKSEDCPKIAYIKTSESLECNGDNEEFAEVVSACPPTCSHPVGPLCMALIRKPSCVCKAGTIRDTVSNRCVRREECPPKEMQLIQSEIKEHIVCSGLNEVFAEWVSACPSKCPTTGIQTPPPPQKCMAIVNTPSCICTNGTIRDTLNNKCVKPEDCPKIA